MIRFIASWFGTGLILGRLRGDPAGSGTVGSLFALPVVLAVGRYLGSGGQIGLFVVTTALSVWVSGQLANTEGDAPWIVVDEAAGVSLTLIGVFAWPGVMAGFVVFRLADIFKGAFPGVAAADRLGSGVGITADDLVAGLYGLAVGHLVQFLI
ncbi:MAG: phosphatidylglycerophosphatase A [Acidimicrobiia bacterium]